MYVYDCSFVHFLFNLQLLDDNATLIFHLVYMVKNDIISLLLIHPPLSNPTNCIGEIKSLHWKVCFIEIFHLYKVD
jgi:hypothetical protein